MSDTCIIDVTKMMIIQMCHRSIEATQIGKVSLTKWVREILAAFMKNLCSDDLGADNIGLFAKMSLNV